MTLFPANMFVSCHQALMLFGGLWSGIKIRRPIFGRHILAGQPSMVMSSSNLHQSLNKVAPCEIQTFCVPRQVVFELSCPFVYGRWALPTHQRYNVAYICSSSLFWFYWNLKDLDVEYSAPSTQLGDHSSLTWKISDYQTTLQ